MNDLPRPWFDAERWPQRRFAARPGVVFAASNPELAELTSRWAALLGRAADDLLICASAPEAAAVLVAGALQPGDTVVLAAPAAEAAVAAILRSGARFVDVGRTFRGVLEPAAVQLALRHHAGAWLLLGECDAAEQAWPALLQAGARPERTMWWDEQRPMGRRLLAVEPSPVGELLTLRDPAEPRTPLLWGVLTDGAAPALRTLGGAPQLHPLLVDAARGALDRWFAQPALPAAWQIQLGAAERSLQTAVSSWPGAMLWPGSGVCRWVRCAADDGPGLADQLRRDGWAVDAASCPAVGSAVRVCLLPATPAAVSLPEAGQG